MRAVVAYESMYGNTRRVAEAIAAGLQSTCSVTLVPVSQLERESLDTADLIVIGGPTHVRGMSRTSTRKAAEEAARTNPVRHSLSKRTPKLRACASGSPRSDDPMSRLRCSTPRSRCRQSCPVGPRAVSQRSCGATA
jgi:Flavodoxin domain